MLLRRPLGSSYVKDQRGLAKRQDRRVLKPAPSRIRSRQPKNPTNAVAPNPTTITRLNAVTTDITEHLRKEITVVCQLKEQHRYRPIKRLIARKWPNRAMTDDMHAYRMK
jgi:hypothetical protein